MLAASARNRPGLAEGAICSTDVTRGSRPLDMGQGSALMPAVTIPWMKRESIDDLMDWNHLRQESAGSIGPAILYLS
ncbi:hypothetical protein PZN02_005073 [Sinorhizobium garamanticum]|uniref:Uncharacterized protein n=1 Tax=Sinorhizobium garamanticum TaxID=680247 RepID=A0ABY8DLG8_9HYPH|nr:hypothetical protein [Sinorhizobium garamanticum]WEX89758.1 hypothetical protein PZN02_005073 [Sinorhizobium garamanticum]